MRVNIFVWVLSISLFSCNSSTKEKKNIYSTPLGFSSIAYPEDNELTKERIELGRLLFYDPILSKDSTLSCASCHKQEFAFADNVAFSKGSNNLVTKRNSPSLANVAYQKNLLMEGGLPSLEMQVLVPIQEHNEFDFSAIKIADRMNKSALYSSLSLQAYNRLPDPYVITRAISSFERTLLSGNSKYDKEAFQYKSVLSRRERDGMAVFFGTKTNCSACHNGYLFTNQGFENNGLYEVYLDEGRKRLTGSESDESKFKIPSLRNISLTAPYMHDGSFKTLREVIEHYSDGGKNHKNKSKLIKKLDLSLYEKEALEEFLKTLTDEEFINKEEHSKIK